MSQESECIHILNIRFNASITEIILKKCCKIVIQLAVILLENVVKF